MIEFRNAINKINKNLIFSLILSSLSYGFAFKFNIRVNIIKQLL